MVLAQNRNIGQQDGTESPEKTQAPMVRYPVTNEGKVYNEGKTLSSINGLGNWTASYL